jgi:hypothetical protein
MERAGTASSTSETSWALWGKMLIHGCGWWPIVPELCFQA